MEKADRRHDEKTQLNDVSGINFNEHAKLGKNEFVAMESIKHICVALNCEINDVMEFIGYEHD